RIEKNTIGYDANFVGINLAEEIHANGVEVEASWLPASPWQVDANYTYTQRKGDNAIRIPRHKLNLSLGYQVGESTHLSLDYAYTGKRKDTDFVSFTDRELHGFSLLNFHWGQELIPQRLQLFLAADNLLNESYTEILGLTTLGRNFRVGMNLSL